MMLLYPFLAVMNITLRNQDSYQEQKKRRNKDGYRGFPWIYFWVVPLAGTLVGMTQVLPVRCQLWRHGLNILLPPLSLKQLQEVDGCSSCCGKVDVHLSTHSYRWSNGLSARSASCADVLSLTLLQPSCLNLIKIYGLQLNCSI